MIEIKETCYKGTRILLGNEKRDLINNMINVLKSEGFQEIFIPIIQHQEIFKGKVGEENNNLMFNFKDRGDRDLCLAPEYTAIVQQLSKSTFKHQKDVRLFYKQECTPEEENTGLLQVIYEDGKFYNITTFNEIRNRLKGQ